MDLLARREHSRRELQDKLLRRFGDRLGSDGPGVVAVELDRLTEEGLQSDERFAESFVRSRLQRRQGPLRVRQEMAQRGIEATLIDLAMQAVDADQWQQAAQEALSGRFGDAPPPDRKEWARRGRFLQGRGFSAAQTYAVLTGFE